jgi:hypothetical protein
MEMLAVRAFEAFVFLVAGPISYLVHHQLVPGWASPTVLWFQILFTQWLAMTRCYFYAPETPFDQVCEIYMRLWE